MTALYLLDDAVARRFEPFALTRPASELRVGALLARERWERALGLTTAGLIVASHLRDFEEPWAPTAASGRLPAGAIVANARCAVSLAPADRETDTWVCDGRVAAARLASATDVEAIGDDVMALDRLHGQARRHVEIAGMWVDEVWDLVRAIDVLLAEDIASLASGARALDAASVTVLGSHAVRAEAEVRFEPHVVVDATGGPVLFRRGATVRAFSRIAGPTVVGAGSTILGGDVAACTIGDVCKVRGEISHAVVIGHANKGHDGFVGHSVLGRWVNLGAGTVTSNLKNTYGDVQLWTPDGPRATGMQFLGTLFGDHAKTGIGTRLTTGTVIGAGANVYGAAMPPKAVPPFAWGSGSPYATFELEKFLEVAERVMQRRAVPLGERARRQLAAAHDGRWREAR